MSDTSQSAQHGPSKMFVRKRFILINNYYLGSQRRTKQHRHRPAIMPHLMLSVNKRLHHSPHRTVLSEFLIHKHKHGSNTILFSMVNVQSFGTNSSFYSFVRSFIIFNVQINNYIIIFFNFCVQRHQQSRTINSQIFAKVFEKPFPQEDSRCRQ